MSERMTCVFECDVRSYKGNPFHASTPFGKPVVVSDSDLAAEHDMQEDRADALAARLEEVRLAVVGWRETDWPEGFDRRTAELIAERVQSILARKEQP